MAERKREGRLGSSPREFPRRDVEDEEEEEEEEEDPLEERERKKERGFVLEKPGFFFIVCPRSISSPKPSPPSSSSFLVSLYFSWVHFVSSGNTLTILFFACCYPSYDKTYNIAQRAVSRTRLTTRSSLSFVFFY